MESRRSPEREIYNNFIVRIRDNLQEKGIIDRVEYAGSHYKGTAVRSSDYDNMFVKRDNTIIAQRSQYPNYFYLKTQNGMEINRTERLATFKAGIQRAIREIGESSCAQITNSYGPTVVVNYRKSGFSFPIDMVYGLEVGEQIFVGKAPREAAQPAANIWYDTKVLDEKNKMRTIDFNNGIGKMVVRRLKTLKEVEPALQVINSYAFEQALMYLKDIHTDDLFWRENNMKEILRVTLLYMADALEIGELPAYFDKHNNAISNLSADQKFQLKNRLRRLADRPDIVLSKTN